MRRTIAGFVIALLPAVGCDRDVSAPHTAKNPTTSPGEVSTVMPVGHDEPHLVRPDQVRRQANPAAGTTSEDEKIAELLELMTERAAHSPFANGGK